MENNQNSANPAPKKPFWKRWYVWVIALMFVFYIIGSTSIDKTKTQNLNTNQPTQTSKISDIANMGDEAYLRLPNSTSSEEIILLASTEDEFKQLLKASIAKDYQGILELPGVFGVSNGVKVLVIDNAYAKRKVRILSAIRDVDQDKIGRTGWVPMEWVSLK